MRGVVPSLPPIRLYGVVLWRGTSLSTRTASPLPYTDFDEVSDLAFQDVLYSMQLVG